jgi:hypothetical protein
LSSPENLSPPALPPEVEDALFDRFMKRLVEAAGSVGTLTSDAAASAASGINSAASVVGSAVGDAATAAGGAASAAGEFVMKHPAALVPLAIGPLAPVMAAAMTALTVKQILEARRSGAEEKAQILFRVPASLHKQIKQLALDKNCAMDELLIEAVVDILAKNGRLFRLEGPAAPPAP